MIRFGPWSTTLGLAAGFGALVALLLWRAPGNRAAQRLLAALLMVAVLRLMPYVLGFAGAYDVWPWLSFAPFNLRLAIGPLLYLYLWRLATPAMPARWGWHLLPAAVDFAYMLWAFALPLERKTAWNDSVHQHWIAPLQDVAGALSLAAYLLLAVGLRRRYLSWLRQHVSDQDAHRQPWIGSVLLATGLWLAVSTGFDLYSYALSELNYYERFPQYLAFSAIILWLGLEGWRHAGRHFPQMTAAAQPEPQSQSSASRDWGATAAAWNEKIRAEGWWRQPGLTLADVARYLGTNETYVSRAFSSKASFNRVFREQTGLSPSAWRAAHMLKSAAFRRAGPRRRRCHPGHRSLGLGRYCPGRHRRGVAPLRAHRPAPHGPHRTRCRHCRRLRGRGRRRLPGGRRIRCQPGPDQAAAGRAGHRGFA